MNAEKSNKKRTIIILTIVFILTAFMLFAAISIAGNHANKLVYEVNSLTAYQYADNPNYYRIEVNGTVRTSFFEKREFDSVQLYGPSMGGSPAIRNTNAESEPVNISREKTEFNLKYDIDISSRDSSLQGDGKEPKKIIESAFYDDCFITSIDDNGYEYKYALFGRDFADIPFEWTESKTVTDSLLYTE